MPRKVKGCIETLFKSSCAFFLCSLICIKSSYHKSRQQDEVTISETAITGYMPNTICLFSD